VKFHHLLKKLETAAQQKKTKTDLNERRPMEDIPPEALNCLLVHFFIKVRKLNGEDFEPGT